jgi:DNA (cytosine-5)-methyltransferase 1
MGKEIKVAELFAGVGGFRLGLEGWNGKSASSGYTRKLASDFRVVWSNQWEPSTKSQEASKVYEERFGPHGHSNQDIAKVDAHEIPDHDLLVGGFPCQDYSVARTLSQSGGLQGKKGVLWWEIHRILKTKLETGSPVGYVFLENVDRLLKSPVKQRGRDFAIILASLSDLGYGVEWRVINAAEYGMPQRRRRTFILAFHQSTPLYQKLDQEINKLDVICQGGIFAKSFPVSDEASKVKDFTIQGDLAEISEEFSAQSSLPSPFENAGTMFARQVCSAKTTPKFEGKRINLGDILLEESEIPNSFYIEESSLDRWTYFKGAKREMRTNKASGFEYSYNEGGMIFPDPLDTPSRTIITGEGGPSPSRFKHVVSQNGKFRRLTPVELERLNMFPDNHTAESTDVKRAFFMGNALVVGVIEKVGQALKEMICAPVEVPVS